MSYSPEAQAVIDRMVDLSPGEEYAIVQMVDTLVASGDWANLYEVFCFVLSPSDYATGWKLHTLTPQGTTEPNRGVGANFLAGSDHFLAPFAPSDLETWNGTGASAGGVVVSSSTGSNYDVFGSASGGVEYYFRNRTAGDVQAILGSSVATPRLGGIAHPFADFYFARSVATTRYIRVGDATISGVQAAVTPGWATDAYVINGRNSGGQQNGTVGTVSWHFIGNESLDDQVMKDAIAQFAIDLENPPPGPAMFAIHAPKRTYTMRPYRFTLDPDHPLGQGLVFAGLGNVAGSENYFDSSAYRNPCSLQSFRESHWVTALGRHGLEFNETPGEYVDNTSYFQGVNQAYTCCFWASITDVVTPDRDMIVETADTFALSVGWGNDGGSGRTNKFQAFVNDVGTRNVVSITNPIAGQLYHVGVTFDGNKVRMHINGIFEAESTGDTTGDNPAGNGLHLGTYRNADDRWQNGMLLDVLVHHRVLPISEMAQLADPDNIMLSGLVREAPKPKTYFFPAEITPTLGYRLLDGPKQRRSVRPYRVKLNSDKQLSTGLVFAGLGSLAGGDVLVDSSPHSKDGIIDGQTWVTQFGRQGLEFPGTSSVVLPHRPSLSPSNGMSWSWWQNCPFNATTPIWSKKVDALNEEYDIQANASGVIFRLYGTPDIFQQTPGGTVANVWQHIVVTYDGSGDRDGMKIYIDGEDLSGFTGTDGAVVNNTGADVELGGDLGTFMEAGCRVLDPVIYDRPLTSDEIRQLGSSNPLLGGWIETERQDVVIPKQPPTEFKSTIFRSRLIRGTSC